MSPPGTLPTDLGKILYLLQEYTRTLREACQRELDRRYRFTVLEVLTVFSVAGAGLYLLQLSSYRKTDFVGPIFVSVALVVAGILLTLIFIRGRWRYSHDADEVSYILSYLVEAASQFSEHANKRIDDRFEFNLRVAEAEAVLRMNKSVFGPPKEPAFGKYSETRSRAESAVGERPVRRA